MVVNAKGKGLATTRSGDRQEEDRKGTTVAVSKRKRRCQNRGEFVTAGLAPTKPGYGRSGIRHERWLYEDVKTSCCTKDEGGPFGAALQEGLQTAISCYGSIVKAAVVNVMVKRRGIRPRHVWIREMSTN
jgi:hypothetical protein